MNETYLFITFTILVFGIVTAFSGWLGGNSKDSKGLLCFSSMFIGAVMLLISGVAPLGDTVVQIEPASNTKIGNELIIQSSKFPTLIVNNIAFIDKEVQVKRTIDYNAWGCFLNEKYVVELIKTEL